VEIRRRYFCRQLKLVLTNKEQPLQAYYFLIQIPQVTPYIALNFNNKKGPPAYASDPLLLMLIQDKSTKKGTDLFLKSVSFPD
jgi:hypothetical protein